MFGDDPHLKTYHSNTQVDKRYICAYVHQPSQIIINFLEKLPENGTILQLHETLYGQMKLKLIHPPSSSSYGLRPFRVT